MAVILIKLEIQRGDDNMNLSEDQINKKIEKSIEDNAFQEYNKNEQGKIDYRYETKDEARDLHKHRKAFIILNGKLEFLPDGSKMSHYEYCQTKKLSKEEFNKITRGYYLNGNVVFYKDNFIYDDNLISEALKFVSEISEKIETTEFDIYFGQLPEQDFALNYYYGKYINGNIIKSNA